MMKTCFNYQFLEFSLEVLAADLDLALDLSRLNAALDLDLDFGVPRADGVLGRLPDDDAKERIASPSTSLCFDISFTVARLRSKFVDNVIQVFSQRVYN